MNRKGKDDREKQNEKDSCNRMKKSKEKKSKDRKREEKRRIE